MLRMQELFGKPRGTGFISRQLVREGLEKSVVFALPRGGFFVALKVFLV